MEAGKRFYLPLTFLLLLVPAMACALFDGTVKLPGQAELETAATTVSSVATTSAVVGGGVDSIATVAAGGGDFVSTVTAGGGVGDIGTVAPQMTALRDRLANVDLSSGSGQVTYTQDEVNRALAEQLQFSLDAGEPAAMQNAEVGFSDGKVRLKGTPTFPPLPLDASFVPKVVDGQVQFVTAEPDSDTPPVPEILVPLTEVLMNLSLGAMLSSLPPGAVIQDVVVGEGTITIVAVPG